LIEGLNGRAMGTDQIRYDLLAQDALRGVVRRVLADAARDGLPGEHHFYISFKTQHPGAKISARLAEKYPDEITIVLQHQFWDLSVNDSGFEVGLSFGNAPEKLVVPFEAISGFFDPSVQFGLKFEVATEESKPAASGPVAVTPAPRPNPRGAASEPDEAPASARGARQAARAERKSSAKTLKVVETAQEPEGKAGEGEKVVNLDTFRKKK
jgi:hypothetical protein